MKETKSWFFEKTNKIDKPLPRLTKKKKKKIEMMTTHFRNEREAITTDHMDIIKGYFKQLYTHQLDNPD